MHYNRYRYYSPYVGRFISKDPIGLLGGLNTFAYAPNPVGWVDPLGLAKVYCNVTNFKGSQSNINYTVYQQTIDWDQKIKIRGGKTETNLDRALRGDAPRIKTASGWSSVNLHHSKQNANGPLFELSGNSHSKYTALPALHPYRPNQHPYNPVDRDIFNIDRVEYWKNRAKEELAIRKAGPNCSL